MTVTQARKMLGCESNYALAKTLGVEQSTVSRWNNKVPDKWEPNIRWLAADGLAGPRYLEERK